MRKLELQQILGLISTIEKSAKHGMFADCIAGTESIVDFIEDEQAPQTKENLASCLELLNKLSNGENLLPNFTETLSKTKKHISEELKPNKIEIAFFPYKASMWDSLESIYLAAKSDPDCDAYVVPIPYFDKNRDGSFGQIHYEISGYPKNIPLVDYNRYSLEERRPDMIFVHNPYDGQNIVTSVHPDYYSDRLKNFTNCLVYVPYFTHRNNVDANSKMPDDFIWAPVFFNANKIILQTEQWKKYYLDGFKRMFGQRFGNADNKFLALGNPKIDKVVNSKPEDFEIPTEWKNLIEKKRVVLYNTSIASMLSGNEEYLTKLEYVLEEFKKQSDSILLWRPHPLSITTYQTMRPMFLNRYLSIVEKYKSENYGIYDDSPDLHRAIVLSDAYFGDNSSVAALYGFTGKPIMFQSLNLPEVQNRISFFSFFKDSKGNAWSWHNLHFNAFFKLNIDENKADFITHCEKKEITSVTPFWQMQERDGILICFPYCSDYILEFNPQTMEKKYIQLDLKHKINPIGFCVYNVLEYKGDYYCFGLASDSVIVLRSDGSVDYLSQIYKQIGQKRKNGQIKAPVYTGPVDEDGNVTILFYETDAIYKYNLPNQTLTRICSDKRLEKVVHCICDKEFLWATTMEPQSLLKIDLKKNSIVEFEKMGCNCYYIADCDNYLLLFPNLSNAILHFDKKAEKFEEFNKMPIPEDLTYNRAKYWMPLRVENKIFMIAQFNRILYELNIDNREVLEHSFNLDDNIYDKYFKGNFWKFESEIKPEQFYANEVNLVHAFHEFIGNFPQEVKGQKETFGKLVANSDGTAGKVIYETLRNFVIQK